MKLGHIGLPVADITKAKVFYDAITPSLGLKQLADHDDFVGYGSKESYEFYVHTGKPGLTGLHVCFEVNSKKAVQQFHSTALTSGGTDNGAPGIREDYSPTYYAAFVLDPDGNNIEAVHRGNNSKTNLEFAEEYFAHSNQKDLATIATLLTDTTTYSSPNVGVFLGKDNIMAMKEKFFASFSDLHWETHSVREDSPGVVCFDFTFSGTTTDGEQIERPGKEYVIIKDSMIQHIEVRNT